MSDSTSSDKPVLVTGGTGFAGSHLYEALLQAGYRNIHLTHFGELSENQVTFFSEAELHQINLTEVEATNQLMAAVKPVEVYHLAAFSFVGKSFERASELLHNNTILQLNVLEAVKSQTPEARVLVIGSAEEYGLSEENEIPITEQHPMRPVNPYAVSKITQDMLGYAYFLSHGLSILRVRPFNHIGERQSTEFAVPAFVSQIIAIEKGEQRELQVGNLSAIRDFTDVKDMVQAYIVVMQRGVPGEVYNIGSGVGVKMEDVLNGLLAAAEIDVAVVQDETRLRPLDIPKIVADNSKVQGLGWQPSIALEETLRRIINWYRKSTP